jgi:uncharacterized membrane protein YhaH (DUF805 family)
MKGLVVLAVPLLFAVLFIAGVWKMFAKAGQPGWAAIIPIYNLYVLTQVAGKAWWWLLLCFIPIVGCIAYIILCLGVANNFGKGAGFAVGLIFLGFIFFPILGFGDAVYGPAAPAPAPAA